MKITAKYHETGLVSFENFEYTVYDSKNMANYDPAAATAKTLQTQTESVSTPNANNHRTSSTMISGRSQRQ